MANILPFISKREKLNDAAAHRFAVGIAAANTAAALQKHRHTWEYLRDPKRIKGTLVSPARSALVFSP